jgi:CheY-like chemotaxis protein
MSADKPADSGIVLIVDDDEAVTGVINAVLGREGYSIHIARNGIDGLRMADEIRPNLILMDISMPDMDGYQATDQLKQNPSLKDIPIILLSSKTASEDDGRSFAKGAVYYVRKPFTGQQLRDLVSLAMDSLVG